MIRVAKVKTQAKHYSKVMELIKPCSINGTVKVCEALDKGFDHEIEFKCSDANYTMFKVAMMLEFN